MALGREPWSMLQRFQDDLSRLLEDPRYGRAGEGDRSSVVTSEWTPAVDIKEEPERFVLLADVPGVDPGEIEITMEQGLLVVRGERRAPDPQESDRYRRVERVYGTFYRRFSLPDTADPERITARGENGVLEIVIPKQEKVQPRRIPVG